MASSKNLLKDVPKPLFQSFLFGIATCFTSCLLLALFSFIIFLGRHPQTLVLRPRVLIGAGSPPFIPSNTSENGTNATKVLNSSSTFLPSAAPKILSGVIQDLNLLKNQKWNMGSWVEGGHGDLASCDLFDGRWVADDLSPNYSPGTCPFIDNAFDCFGNGRADLNYMKLRWQPKGCRIPRLEGKRMLELLRGKRLVFAGDSLNRNMWESLVCILRNSLRDKRRVFEIAGRTEFRTNNSYAVRFIDYNCSIEFFRSPFLVQPWARVDAKGRRRETLRLDLIEESSSKFEDADVIVFNSGHWWTHEKTSKGKNYYEEDGHVYPQLRAAEAYGKAMRTWARWIDTHIDSKRTRVFFRGYSSSHFSGGRRWSSGGTCDGETLPITNDKHLAKYPALMQILGSVIKEMRTPVLYLNITRMTDYRKDAHPSVYRQPAAQRKPGAVQDCSHWCLPGVPDAWNELLYAMLLRGSGGETRSS
ncbi:protein trichome birefringence-like 4 [Phoenix dactylifera]|uniref:Protein trichome birefringence-like 4 n=1 Tax=Phoenix dactylifera TaxID=42345 RepID=A0A8B7C3P6_PHODC|nr:protein trichome birefringence-like 4 [Phoenix dactylifera]